mmetsp:Transcript_18985/g.47137  ORF Transcript_18985/g.47137 Transcript_18985/m.47137 type:complete len:904 (+) Transcript_18985:165-2876(+)|eukprot:CAMPEP_0116092774 /NCGR_PEP_ID=MMETSP0327-20121206/8223_1 /TAXON_ID=44447 /ORGANISM="Pseudo-nitzschia delicatissima, Strain B596" /LENGTH=903 /DNA_ID=CAMNT_0003584225 /DNA_START=123 /DNA_END=2834 /DNA_ORIENTATION=+
MVLFDNLPESPDDTKTDLTLKSNKTFSTKKTSTGSIGYSTISGKSNASSASTIEEHAKGVVLGKWTFVFFLAVVAAFLGVMAYYLLARAEQNLWEEQYESMTARAIETIQLVAASRLLYGPRIMAEVAAHSFPNAEDWPYVWIDGYWDIVHNVIPTSLGTGMNLAPIVDPAVVNVTEFEDFVYGKFEEVFPDNPDMGARSHFGKGIWVQDASIDTVDNRFHDTTGVSIHGSERVFMAPKIQGEWIGVIDSAWVMMNVHGFNNQGKAVDYALDCVEERAKSDDPDSFMCQGLSPMQPSKAPQEHLGMFGFVATPIYPANDRKTCTGFIFGLVYFSELLGEMYPKDVRGIDCVFSTEDQVFTYSVENGKGEFTGEGDWHNPDFDQYKWETLIIDPETMSPSSEQYTCACYPNEEFAQIYEKGIPGIACAGAIGIIFFMSALFFLYDRCVSREFDYRKDLLEAKRQFVRFVSHEVRTPLNSVGMGLTLMKEEMAQSLGFKSAESMVVDDDKVNAKSNTDNGSDAAAREWFSLADEIQSNTQCAVDVLNDLLNYDKIENGSLNLELTVVPIWQLIEQTVIEFKLPMGSKNIKLTFNLPEDKGYTNNKVVGDAVRLSQVLRNLISNAIKFTPEGGDIDIEASWIKDEGFKGDKNFELKGHNQIHCKSSGKLVVTVKDSGAGMTQDQLKKLFGKGVQFNVNELQHGNGSGLGLYISKGIIEQHDGQLLCNSKGLGCGTCFMMRIPVFDFTKQEEEKKLAEALSDDECAPDMAYEDSKLRILVVDDSISNRKLLCRLLSNQGHVNSQAEDGSVAVEMVMEAEKKGEPFDMVLMDYEMPNMTGPEAARVIRSYGSDVFIVGVTGNLMPEDVDYFHECGAGAILSKPFRMSELDNLIFEHNITGSIVDDELV